MSSNNPVVSDNRRSDNRDLTVIRCVPAQHYGYIFTDDIVAKIRESGFKIAMKKEVQLNKEQAEEFYSEHKDQEYFDELTNRMSS